jgi:hypothetical protein
MDRRLKRIWSVSRSNGGRRLRRGQGQSVPVELRRPLSQKIASVLRNVADRRPSAPKLACLDASPYAIINLPAVPHPRGLKGVRKPPMDRTWRVGAQRCKLGNANNLGLANLLAIWRTTCASGRRYAHALLPPPRRSGLAPKGLADWRAAVMRLRGALIGSSWALTGCPPSSGCLAGGLSVPDVRAAAAGGRPFRAFP